MPAEVGNIEDILRDCFERKPEIGPSIAVTLRLYILEWERKGNCMNSTERFGLLKQLRAVEKNKGGSLVVAVNLMIGAHILTKEAIAEILESSLTWT